MDEITVDNRRAVFRELAAYGLLVVGPLAFTALVFIADEFAPANVGARVRDQAHRIGIYSIAAISLVLTVAFAGWVYWSSKRLVWSLEIGRAITVRYAHAAVTYPWCDVRLIKLAIDQRPLGEPPANRAYRHLKFEFHSGQSAAVSVSSQKLLALAPEIVRRARDAGLLEHGEIVNNGRSISVVVDTQRRSATRSADALELVNINSNAPSLVCCCIALVLSFAAVAVLLTMLNDLDRTISMIPLCLIVIGLLLALAVASGRNAATYVRRLTLSDTIAVDRLGGRAVHLPTDVDKWRITGQGIWTLIDNAVVAHVGEQKLIELVRWSDLENALAKRAGLEVIPANTDGEPTLA